MAKATGKKKSEEIGINGLNSISNLEAEIMKIVWDICNAVNRLPAE